MSDSTVNGPTYRYQPASLGCVSKASSKPLDEPEHTFLVTVECPARKRRYRITARFIDDVLSAVRVPPHGVITVIRLWEL